MQTPPSSPEPTTHFSTFSTSEIQGLPFSNTHKQMLSPYPHDSFLKTEIRPAQPPVEFETVEKQINRNQMMRDEFLGPAKTPSRSSSSKSTDTKPTKLTFICPFEEVWINISTLYRHPNDRSQREIACENLKRCKTFAVEFYLPQLCFLLIYQHQYSDMLEMFILDKCASSAHFAIKTSFILGAVLKEDAELVLIERVENFRYACQLAYIDGKRPILEHNASPIDDFSASSSSPELDKNQNDQKHTKNSNDTIQHQNHSAQSMTSDDSNVSNMDDKTMTDEKMEQTKTQISNSRHNRDLRFKYLWSIKRFVRELAEIGNKLLKSPEVDRAASLKNWLKDLNAEIQKSAENPEDSRYISGLYIPFSTCDDIHYCITRIPEHEASMLKSRERVPFTICLETISLPKQSTNISSEEISEIQSNGHQQENDMQTDFHLCGDSNIESLASRYSSLLQSQSRSSRSNSIQSIKTVPTKTIHDNSSTVETEKSLRSTMMTSTSSSEIHQHRKLSGILSSSAPTSTSSSPITSDLNQLHHLLSTPQNTHMIQRKELWNAKENRIRRHSNYSKLVGWRLRSVIIKYGPDCLQEQLALQLIEQFSLFFDNAKLPLVLVPYKALVVEGDACLIEPLVDAISIHQLKKNNKNISLHDFYLRKWNGPDSKEFKLAQRNFVQSLAAYSLVCYVLQLKDRHNGNIMIDEEGHIIHIDWGFLLWNSPGSIGFETAPFKLTAEYLSLMGGIDSSTFAYFKSLFAQGFLELRRHSEQIIDLIKIMFMCSSPTKIPCSQGGDLAIAALESRFVKHLSDLDCVTFTEDLISQSANNWRTVNYDYFQYYSNGIF